MVTVPGGDMTRWLPVLAAATLLVAEADATFFIDRRTGFVLTGSAGIEFTRNTVFGIDGPLLFSPGHEGPIQQPQQQLVQQPQQQFVQQPQQQFVQQPQQQFVQQPQQQFVQQPQRQFMQQPQRQFMQQPQRQFVQQPQRQFMQQPQRQSVQQPQRQSVQQSQQQLVQQPQQQFVQQSQRQFVQQSQQQFVQQPQQQFVQQPPVAQKFIPCSRNQVQATGEHKNYHFSWCHTQRVFTRDQAVAYCRRLGKNVSPVSMETPNQDAFVTSIVDTHLDFPNPWIWTSGRRVRGMGDAQDSWVWETARGDVPHTVYNNWSHTGGDNLPQPDNREGNENFLAVLKNAYNDGVRWHDIAGHHTKHVICEGRMGDFDAV